jgi:hypothetical protein
MWKPWRPQSRNGFWDLLPGKNPRKFLFLKPNPLIDGMIAQAPLKKEFFQKFEHITPPGPQANAVRYPGRIFAYKIFGHPEDRGVFHAGVFLEGKRV